MSKGTNQKLKLYYLAKIMISKTDDDHYLTMPQIKDMLEEYGITADRKSLYDDMEALRNLGIDVLLEHEGRNYYYHVGSKHFELAELKLLVDAIQASKFITEKKSNALIKKLTALVSEYEASQLKRQVEVQGRIKTMNESIYYTVDDIHNAIINNKAITFEYLKWNLQKELVPRKEERYEVSPWALTWDDENYYLIAYDDESQKIKHYRVDKINKIKITDKKRQGKEHFAAFDMAAYSKMNFGMFGGKETKVKLRFKDEMVGVLLDRFGKDISIRKSATNGWSETNVDVAVSDQFFGWIFALGGSVVIAGPDEVKMRFKEELEKVKELYK
ncbi:Predicted DNA-binding transcriptional regulator YafY, contains an HTH and WYL domains [Butyrivibrio hungatei DSM 14810]|uniref:Predicted DNA-binding transcriptional regulator YafY, contains an HTH and WYL domains n=1 Tax=Butyrivibrio hungatei DSM 14810 TaxID=1121132 RepID=A0A1M7S5G7_9FIRM|nr:WYL domain-containing protein [Butyrivibrio hungatei]SHN53698.1 Predicted DNA-binding transcriptional regulator YafY, contains an HTH and WYL domains [Butyrivibrio hungatei DSM 14810]